MEKVHVSTVPLKGARLSAPRPVEKPADFSPPIQVDVVTTYLEMRSEKAIRPSKQSGDPLTVGALTTPIPELNRFFYTVVGRDWWWTDRLNWSRREWEKYVSRNEFETCIAYVGQTPIGYFELETLQGDVEIVSFGLLPQFFGRNLGGRLLTETLYHAWKSSPSRVWVHTCTLDHPYALKNYIARGMTVYKTEKAAQIVQPPDLWPRE